MDEKKIKSNIKLIKKNSTSLNKLVQDTLVGALEHAAEHGNISIVRDVCLALPASFRREYAINWAAYYGNVGIDSKTGKCQRISRDSKRWKASSAIVNSRGENGYDLDGARANPWHNPESVPSNRQPESFEANTLLDFQDNVINFVERMRKQIKDGVKKLRDGTEVPLYVMTDDEEAIAMEELTLIENVGKKGLTRANIENLKKQLEAAEAALDEAA